MLVYFAPNICEKVFKLMQLKNGSYSRAFSNMTSCSGEKADSDHQRDIIYDQFAHSANTKGIFGTLVWAKVFQFVKQKSGLIKNI